MHWTPFRSPATRALRRAMRKYKRKSIYKKPQCQLPRISDLKRKDVAA